MGKPVAFVLFVAMTSVCHAQPGITRYELHYSINFETKKLFCSATIDITPGDTLNLLLYRLLTVRSIRDKTGRSISFTQHVESFSDWQQLQVNAVTVPVRNITQLQIDRKS